MSEAFFIKIFINTHPYHVMSATVVNWHRHLTHTRWQG